MKLEPANRKARWAISAFIIFNIIAITHSTSEKTAHQSTIQQLVMPYLVWTRLNQSWPLFVPAPRDQAKRYRVDIQFRDGTSTSWRRPYPPNWDFFERHLAYNFQKWDLANNYLDRKFLLWGDLAHFIKHEYWKDQNPPVTITLMRESAQWLPPNPEGYAWHDGEEKKLEWHDEKVFEYDVAGNTYR